MTHISTTNHLVLWLNFFNVSQTILSSLSIKSVYFLWSLEPRIAEQIPRRVELQATRNVSHQYDRLALKGKFGDGLAWLHPWPLLNRLSLIGLSKQSSRGHLHSAVLISNPLRTSFTLSKNHSSPAHLQHALIMDPRSKSSFCTLCKLQTDHDIISTWLEMPPQKISSCFWFSK